MASRSQPKRTYHVFLSFRGPDCRDNIVSHLYDALCRTGIHTYIDSEKLRKGERISKALMNAIEDSRIGLIIFSEKYASSTWCLDEVAKIMQCKETNGLSVLPVFYKVEPREVRNGRQSYKEAFDNHEKKCNDGGPVGFNLEDVDDWKTALRQAGSLSGWAYGNGIVVELKNGYPIQSGGREYKSEAELVRDIVNDISRRLGRIPLDISKYSEGTLSRVNHLISKLKMSSRGGAQDDGLTIGLWAMGGMGKTILAIVLYNSIFENFEESAFLDGISSDFNNLERLQEKLLLKLTNTKIRVTNRYEGISLIKERLCCKRVLLILDGVDDMCQIDSLAKERDWFGEGSRIIITTTNETLLDGIGAPSHGVQCLDNDEARELFMKHASRNGNRNRKIRGDLVDEVLQYTRRLPLALEVLGRAFAASEENEWKSKLVDFAESSDQSIDKVLRISYDALDFKKQQIFLHIACFFNGWSRRYVEGVLKNCELSVETGVRDLIRRSLIMEENGTLKVHDLIEKMGKNIVDGECHGDAAKRSRFWRLNDVRNVLSGDEGTDALAAVAIVLAPPEPEKMDICSEAFKKLKNLRFLIMINVETDFRDPICLPRELRWFEWPECPASSLILTSPDNLTVLAVRKHLFKEPEEP